MTWVFLKLVGVTPFWKTGGERAAGCGCTEQRLLLLGHKHWAPGASLQGGRRHSEGNQCACVREFGDFMIRM